MLGLFLVGFVLDDDLRRPIQSKPVWPRRGSLLSLGHWVLLVSAVPWAWVKRGQSRSHRRRRWCCCGYVVNVNVAVVADLDVDGV